MVVCVGECHLQAAFGAVNALCDSAAYVLWDAELSGLQRKQLSGHLVVMEYDGSGALPLGSLAS